MVARLVERHGRVAADAPLLLRFSTAVVSDRDAAAAAGTRGGGGGRGGGRNLSSALISGSRNLQSGSPPARVNGAVRYRVTAALERRDGGQVLWTADVTTLAGEQGGRGLPAELATSLVDTIGRTVDPVPAAAAR